MKKFCFLFFFILTLYSCSNDSESTNQPNPNLLQRVDFYPNSPNEKRWLFNTDGLLEKITKADGTVIQDFTYNSNNLLISSTEYTTSGNVTHTFTYTNEGFVSSVNNQILLYDASIDTYFFNYSNNGFSKFKINNDKLLISSESGYLDEIEVGEFVEIIDYDVTISYTNNNILNYFPGEQCNYLTYDNNTNPLRNGTLAICKAFSFVNESRWPFHYCISANNVLSHSYCSIDPESNTYHYTYNQNNLPVEQTHDYYYLGTLEDTVISAKYYYQGDVLP